MHRCFYFIPNLSLEKDDYIDSAFTLKVLLGKKIIKFSAKLPFCQITKIILTKEERRCHLCILEPRNFPKQLRKAITKIHGNNEMKIKLYAILTQPTKINKDLRQVCPISPTLFNTFISQIIAEWIDKEINVSKFNYKRTSRRLCSWTTNLLWQIQKTHYKFLYINWRQLRPNME